MRHIPFRESWDSLCNENKTPSSISSIKIVDDNTFANLTKTGCLEKTLSSKARVKID